MADLNNCAFTGRLTRDAETKTVGSKGTLLTTTGIAVTTGFGQYEVTSFFNVQIWGKQGEAVSRFLTKGKQVALAGQLENRKYTTQDGVTHDSWTLTASSVTLLADSHKSENNNSASPWESVTTDGMPEF